MPISQKQYLWHPTHSSWSCHICAIGPHFLWNTLYFEHKCHMETFCFKKCLHCQQRWTQWTESWCLLPGYIYPFPRQCVDLHLLDLKKNKVKKARFKIKTSIQLWGNVNVAMLYIKINTVKHWISQLPAESSEVDHTLISLPAWPNWQIILIGLVDMTFRGSATCSSVF